MYSQGRNLLAVFLRFFEKIIYILLIVMEIFIYL